MPNKNEGKLINVTFNGLVFTTPISLLVILVIAKIPTSVEMSIILALGIIVLSLISPIVALIFFIVDRGFLKNQGAFCPHWGWIFLPPVYVFKRLKHNNLSLGWFWIYVVLNVLLPVIVNNLI